MLPQEWSEPGGVSESHHAQHGSAQNKQQRPKRTRMTVETIVTHAPLSTVVVWFSIHDASSSAYCTVARIEPDTVADAEATS